MVGLGLLLAACTNDDPPPVADGSIPAGEVCGAEVQPPQQSGSHLIGDAQPPVTYSSNPPSSGWHRGGAPALGVQTEPLSGPALVSALEFGHVVVAHDPGLDEASVTALHDLAVGALADRLTVTPWPDNPSPISLVGWGVLKRCNDVDVDVIADFTLTWYGESRRHG